MLNIQLNRICCSLLVGATILSLVGCGGPKYEIVPVNGKAAFADGTKLPEGTRLMLSPASGGAGIAIATLQADGSFELVHATGKKGAEVGKYSVEIRPPESAGADFWKNIPEHLASGSVTTVEVSKGMTAIDIKLSKEETM
jgi:hypothetical protein